MQRKMMFVTFLMLILLCTQRPDIVWSKPASPAMLFQITPFLSCVDINEGAGTLTAYFGYESFEANVTEVGLGSENRFLPSPADRRQPVLFFPGYHDKAFRVTVPKTSALLWIFNGNDSAFADATKPRCSAQPSVADIVPFVESITVNGATAMATVTFGYQNASATALTIPAGTSQNRLSRTTNQTQPTEFLPGLQRNAFTTSFPANESLFWMVQGLPALAVPGTCPTITVRVR